MESKSGGKSKPKAKLKDLKAKGDIKGGGYQSSPISSPRPSPSPSPY